MKHILSLCIMHCAFCIASSAQGVKLVKPIAHVRQVSVTAPQGTAPLLPYRLWTTYTDSTAEFRQVVWEGSDLATEEALTRRKAGEKYTVKGRIAGDGQQVTANVTVAPPCPPEGGVAAHGGNISSPLGGTGGAVASPLPLDKVKLTGHNRLTEARDLDLKHLLSLDVTQQLYNYRDTYGLPTEGYTESDGWDSPTTKLKGHGTGHYLSSLALAFASAPDAATRKAVLQRIRRMVDEMRQCQERTFVFDKTLGRYREARDLAPEAELEKLGGTWADFDRYKRDYAHYGYGYLNAIPAQHCALIEAYRPYNNESGVWAPYYTVHKQLSGLIDIATLVTDKAVSSKALLIAKDMGLWVWNRMHYRTQATGGHFGDRSRMWNMYIAGEVGGMSESLARLSELCPKADDKTRLLEAAKCFDSPKFFDPLTIGIDGIRGRHANQHIPMIVGSVEVYKAGGEQRYLDMAIAFWHHIQGRYRYAMGGVGNGEMFRQPYTQLLSLTTNGGADPEPTANETCCAYNLAKLSRSLNCFFPDNAALMDYHERLLYNQIIGSLRLSEYATTYQYAVGLDADKPWGNDTPQSTCCGGTGTENHLRYQEATYWTGGVTGGAGIPACDNKEDILWIAQYMPTEAQWGKTTVTQECEWPAESTSIIIGGKTRRFTLRLRVPYWATKEFAVKLNGETVIAKGKPGTYCEIPCREWHAGDRVEITMPFALHVDYTPDRLTAAALAKYSPFLQPKDKQPMWAGAVMLGPLVMTATDIRSWQDATLAADATAQKLSSTALQLGSHKLVADYLADTHTTHYLCFPGAADAVADSLTAARELATAKQRIAEQQAWQAETKHTTAFAPWAPNGFRRLAEAVAAGDATAISVALATMRPGNLAEPEDLAPLLALISKAKDNPKADEAVAYARMVVSYVRDGSGTHDMIEKAISKFKDVKM